MPLQFPQYQRAESPATVFESILRAREDRRRFEIQEERLKAQQQMYEKQVEAQKMRAEHERAKFQEEEPLRAAKLKQAQFLAGAPEREAAAREAVIRYQNAPRPDLTGIAEAAPAQVAEFARGTAAQGVEQNLAMGTPPPVEGAISLDPVARTQAMLRDHALGKTTEASRERQRRREEMIRAGGMDWLSTQDQRVQEAILGGQTPVKPQDQMITIDGPKGSVEMRRGDIPNSVWEDLIERQTGIMQDDDGSKPPPTRQQFTEDGQIKYQVWDKNKDGGPGWVTEGTAPRSVDALNSISSMDHPLIAELARGIYERRIDPNFITKRGAPRMALVSHLAKYYPDYNLKILAGESAAARNVKLNTAVAVLRSVVEPQGGAEKSVIDQLVEAHEKVGFTQIPLANKFIRAFHEQTGNDDILEYDNLRTSVAMELGNALAAAALTDSRLELELKNWPKNPSYKQIVRVAETMKDVVKARLNSFRAAQGLEQIDKLNDVNLEQDIIFNVEEGEFIYRTETRDIPESGYRLSPAME